MIRKTDYDAVVVGSGPNGLAASILLAQAGLSLALFESKEMVGGGMRSAELTLPGFVHDVCSAIHPLVLSSPFLVLYHYINIAWKAIAILCLPHSCS